MASASCRNSVYTNKQAIAEKKKNKPKKKKKKEKTKEKRAKR